MGECPVVDDRVSLEDLSSVSGGGIRVIIAPRRTRRPTILAVVAFSVLGAIATGCGSDSSRTNSSSKQPTPAGPTTSQRSVKDRDARPQPKQRFIQQANAVCRRLVPRAEQIRRRYLFTQNASVRQQGFFVMAREVRASLGEMKALRPPIGGRKAVRAIYAATIGAAAQLDQAARRPAVAGKILSGVDPFAQTAALARAYGLTSCQATPLVSKRR